MAPDEQELSSGRILIKRGDIFWVRLDPSPDGSQQEHKLRPLVIIQNDVGNEHSPWVIGVPCTTKKLDVIYPVDVFLPKGAGGLKKDSKALCNLIYTIPKTNLVEFMGHLDDSLMEKIDQALIISLALERYTTGL